MSGANSNTSATGGYLVPSPPAPPAAVAIEAGFQQMVAALSGLPGSLVRPRWQPTPPTQPTADTNWASIGVIRTEADMYPSIRHDGRTTLPGHTEAGVDVMTRHSTVTVLMSFYGPLADDVAAQVRDGLFVPQNWEPMIPLGIKFLSNDDFTRMPELVNQQWINRVDMEVRLRHQIDRTYPIFNLVGAVVDLISDNGDTETVEIPGSMPIPTPYGERSA